MAGHVGTRFFAIVVRPAHRRSVGFSLLPSNRLAAGNGFHRQSSFFSRVWQTMKEDAAKNKDIQEPLSKVSNIKKKVVHKVAESKEAEDVAKAFSKVSETAASTKQELESHTQEAWKKFGSTAEEVSKKSKGFANVAAENPVLKEIGGAAKNVAKKGIEASSAASQKFKESKLGSTISDFSSKVSSHLTEEDEWENTAKKHDPKKFPEPPPDSTGIALRTETDFDRQWKKLQQLPAVKWAVDTGVELKKRVDESDNAVVVRARDSTYWVMERVKDLSEHMESDDALVYKEIKKVDPSFNAERFKKLTCTPLLTTFLHANVIGDGATMKELGTEVMKNQIDEVMKQEHLKYEGQILEVRDIEIAKAAFLGKIPALVITCQTDEVQVIKDVKENKVIHGSEDAVVRRTHAFALTPSEDDPSQWRIAEYESSMEESMS